MNVAIKTRNEVIGELSDMVEGILHDHVRGYIDGDQDSLMMFKTWRSLKDWHNIDLINNWCEICSDGYFSNPENKDIDEVLMTINENKVGAHIERIWMASRKEKMEAEDVKVNPSDIGAI